MYKWIQMYNTFIQYYLNISALEKCVDWEHHLSPLNQQVC